jgi:hypothetical protein
MLEDDRNGIGYAPVENFNQLPAPGEKIPSPGEVNKGKGGDKDAVATTPAEESKGKPKVAE